MLCLSPRLGRCASEGSTSPSKASFSGRTAAESPRRRPGLRAAASRDRAQLWGDSGNGSGLSLLLQSWSDGSIDVSDLSTSTLDLHDHPHVDGLHRSTFYPAAKIVAGLDDPPSLFLVHSVSLEDTIAGTISGRNYYEERCLVDLLYLNQPDVRLCIPTSEPVSDCIINYYLQMLTNSSIEDAKSRLLMVPCHDTSPRPLSHKLLERPHLLEKVRRFLGPNAAMCAFMSTAAEMALSEQIGVPLLSNPHDAAVWGTKYGSRIAFRDAGIPHPRGSYKCAFSIQGIAEQIYALCIEAEAASSPLKKVMVKQNDGVSGLGNALFTIPTVSGLGRDAAIERLCHALVDPQYMVPVDGKCSPAKFMEWVAQDGGIIEEFLDWGDLTITSPSVQMLIRPDGSYQVLSTHEQILDGGGIYAGCTFPADRTYRVRIQEAGKAVAAVLSARGCRERFSVDFLCGTPSNGSGDQMFIAAIEVNLRWSATTFPMNALCLLTGGELNQAGEFCLPLDSDAASPKQQQRCYTDLMLRGNEYRGLTPEVLLDFVEANPELQYCGESASGVIFYGMGWLSQCAKVGMVSIARDSKQATEQGDRAVEVLKECISDVSKTDYGEHTWH